MITLIKSLSHNKDQEDQPARPPPSPSVQLPPHVKASVRELQDLSVFSDTGNGLASHQLATPKRDPHTLVIIDTDAAIMQCFATLKELRPHLEREGFVEQVKQQQHEGYRLVAAPGPSGTDFAAVLGYRIMHKLECGRFMYIDDLITGPAARKMGLAALLVDFAVAMAKQEGCSCVQLDSGEARHAAHRLYLNKGFRLEFHHFIHRLQ